MTLLEDFDITLERGFLPKEDPLNTFAGLNTATDIKHVDLMKLEKFAARIPEMMATGTLRQEVDKLSQNSLHLEFSVEGISIETGYKRAMMLLSFMGHAYLWGGREPAKAIPAAIAIPYNPTK